MTNLHIAIQMDPIDEIDINGDTSFRLALEAQRREHLVHVYRPEDLSWEEGLVSARVQAVTLRDVVGDHVTIGPSKTTSLEIFDVVLMRQDPPFDMEYIYSTYLLERAEREGTLVVNRCQSLRDCNEKLFATEFPECCPTLLVSRDMSKLKAFHRQHQDVIFQVKIRYDLLDNRSFVVFKNQYSHLML